MDNVLYAAAIKSGDPSALLQCWEVTPPTEADVHKLVLSGHFDALKALFEYAPELVQTMECIHMLAGSQERPPRHPTVAPRAWVPLG